MRQRVFFDVADLSPGYVGAALGVWGISQQVGLSMDWVYDKVIDPITGEVVALQYHENQQEGCCLRDDIGALTLEGLVLDTSEMFPTLAAARAHAWKDKDKFCKGLD